MIFHSANNQEQTIQDNPGRADPAPTAHKQHGKCKQTPPRFRGGGVAKRRRGVEEEWTN